MHMNKVRCVCSKLWRVELTGIWNEHNSSDEQRRCKQSTLMEKRWKRSQLLQILHIAVAINYSCHSAKSELLPCRVSGPPEIRKQQLSWWKDAKEKSPCVHFLSFQDFYPLKVKCTLKFQFIIFFFLLQERVEKKNPLKSNGTQVQKMNNFQCADRAWFHLIVCTVHRVAEEELECCWLTGW